MDKLYHQINDVVVSIFNNVLHIEEQILVKSSHKNVTMGELHTIEAIGNGTKKTMSEIAKTLHITVGTATTSINNLVKKEYVKRSKDENDRRLVYVELTSKGRMLYRLHEKFHINMIENTVKNLDTVEQKNLMISLQKLSEFLQSYGTI